MKQTNETAFGTIRSYVWPIHAHELRKIVPMFIMLFCVCFNYSVLRNLKDSLVVTAKSSGAEIIPFIKVWVLLPAAIAVTMLFTYLSNRYSRRTVFYLVVTSFLVLFFIFAFFIYPHRESLHPHAFADTLEASLPAGFKGLIAMVRNWTLTCFYVTSELWGSIVLTVLVWGFANEITKMSEATRFYSVLSIGANVAAIMAGLVSVIFSSYAFLPNLFFNSAWEQSFAGLISLVIISGIGLLISFHWMNKHVLTNPVLTPEEKKVKRKEKKLTFKESLLYVGRSKYLLCIAALVICYNLVIGLVEVIWKDQLRVLYPEPGQYNIYANALTSAQGIISTTASLAMAGIIGRFGWTKTALITPVVLLVTSCTFFLCLLAPNTLSPIVSALLGTTPVALAVFLGSLQNCFSKAAKYSLFDATKEMSFIPLTSEHKLKGKAAIDGVGSRFGKSGASFIHQSLLFVFYTLSSSAPYVAVILLVAIGGWILAVISLGKQFEILKATPEGVSSEIEQRPAIATSQSSGQEIAIGSPLVETVSSMEMATAS